MSDTMPFKIYANCILVRGASRSCICDLQRNRIHLIPSILHDILERFAGQSIACVKEYYSFEEDEIIDEYFAFLNDEEIIFYGEFPFNFPSLNMQWESPTLLNNCIIDLDERSDFDLDQIINSLNNLDCQFLEVRSFTPFKIDFYDSLLRMLEGSTISSVTLIVPYLEENGLDLWDAFCNRFLRVTAVVIHSSPIEQYVFSSRFQTPIDFIPEMILNEQSCGKVHQSKFISSTALFTESLHKNTCLNCKVGVDSEGNIKNCPSMLESFGNVKHNTLEEIIDLPEFRRKWNINKDEVSVCKDCEFRHVCTDCRAYLDDPNDEYSKPLKCGYDPYSCEWEEWSNNPLKQKSITYYSLQKRTGQDVTS